MLTTVVKRRVTRRCAWRSVWGGLAVLALTMIVALNQHPLAAQNPPVNRATITEILESSQVYIQERQARVNDQASLGQRLRTGQARAELRFNTDAVGRLGRNSVLVVGQVGQCAQLQRGMVLFNGAVQGCTPTTTASVRGTTYTLAVDEDGQEQIQVLEGEVSVGSVADPAAQPVPLRAGQRVRLRAGQVFGAVEPLSQAEFSDLLKGPLFEGFSSRLRSLEQIRGSFERLFPGTSFPLRRPSPRQRLNPLRRLPGLPGGSDRDPGSGLRRSLL